MKKIAIILSLAAMIFASCGDDTTPITPTPPGPDPDPDPDPLPWDGSSMKAPEISTLSVDGITYNVYEVADPAELAWIADQINSGTSAFSTQDMSISLTEDIDLNNKAWTPIGYTDYSSVNGNPNITESMYTAIPLFTGSIFGNGHTISNINLADVTTPARGLFGQVIGTKENPAVVRDIHIKNVTVNGDGKWAGGLIGYVRDVELIDNCSAENVVIKTGPATSSDTFGAGGLIGYISSTDDITISNCSTKNVEFGLTGWNNSGFIGKLYDNKKVTIENCQPSQGYVRTFFPLGATIGGITFYLDKDGYNNSWFIGNVTNTADLELTITNVTDNSGNWVEQDSHSRTGDITEQEKDAAFAWPYLTVFDGYDKTSLNTVIIIDGQELDWKGTGPQ